MQRFPLISLTLSSILIAQTSQAVLTPTAQHFINQAKTHREQATDAQKQSYYFNLGLSYVTNPTAIGHAIYQESKSKPSLPFSIAQFAKSSESYITCKFEDVGCLEGILTESKSQKKDNPNVATDADFILNRYYQFLANPPAVTLAENGYEAPVPAYTYLYEGQRLSFLRNLRLAQTGKVSDAMDNSLYELGKLRYQMARADTMIGKMAMNLMISRQLQQNVVLKTQFDSKPIQPIALLTEAERDLTLPLLDEFYSTKSLLEKVESQMDEASKRLYQHDDTLNAYADYMQKQMSLAKLDAATFAKYRQTFDAKNQGMPVKANQVTNPIGYKLANIAVPDYQQFAERVLATNNLITITNYVLTEGKTGLTNTFSPTVSDVKKEKDKLCMALPKLDSNKYGCLRVKISDKSK